MNALLTPTMDHREETRVEGHAVGRMEAPKAFFPQAGFIDIEEVSGCGLRVRSRYQLHRDQELVLRIPGSPLGIHATVVWVREAPSGFMGGYKTWIAGCRLQAESIAKVRFPPKLEERRFRGWGPTLLRLTFLLLGAAAVAYLFLRFVSTLG